jgi:glycosyltransferase involved in cell wall biosynthesis
MENKKLKILNLVGQYYPDIGGTEQECRNLAKQFKKEGHLCTVLTTYKESLPSYELIDGIPVYRKIRGWHIYETTYILSVFFLLFKFRKSFDHVICFGLKRFTAPAIIFCRLFGKKVFFRIESPGSFNQTLKLKYGTLIYRISKFAHGTIVFTKEILAILDRMDFPQKKITWIPNSVDTDLFSPGIRNQESPITLCFVGRLVKIKGLNTFIKALGTLSKKTKDFKVLIVGEGELKKALSEQADQYGIEDIVTFSGNTDNVLSYYKKSDIFVLPSISEGMPLAMLEAMSCGLCCIGSSVGGIKELMGAADEDTGNNNYQICHNGIMFPPEDSDTLQQALLKIMGDHKLRKRLAENARKLILQNNEIVITTEHYINLINKQK